MDRKICFEINYGKALEAVLYVLSKRERMNIYNLMKVLFEADKFHLNAHGRPVTGDAYIKMEHGTVPSVIYDFTKDDALCMAALGITEYPFEKVDGYFLKARRLPNMTYLSESDIEALDRGIAEYADLSFVEVREKNHQEKCWVNGSFNSQISFEDMIDNPEVLEYLRSTALDIVV